MKLRHKQMARACIRSRNRRLKSLGFKAAYMGPTTFRWYKKFKGLR